MGSTNGSKLERWLGAEQVEQISRSMRGWYGPPIAVARVPGNVRVCADGDFIGRIDGGGFASLVDWQRERLIRAFKRWSKAQRLKAEMAGFSSLGDLISEATVGGKSRDIFFQKNHPTGVAGSCFTMWRVGNSPVAAGAASAAPGGNALTDASTGAFGFTNPTGGDTMHFVRADAHCGAASYTLLLYDRLFQVAKTMNSTANEAVTGVPSRYQSTTGGAADSAEGNFLFIECQTALPATAHNWDTCLYEDQSGNTGAALPTVTGITSCIINRLDQNAGTWFCPLASGDTGIKDLEQMHCSALVASGAIAFVIGHPIAMIPIPAANLVNVTDGINSAFNLTRIFDDACLALLSINAPGTGTPVINVWAKAVAG